MSDLPVGSSTIAREEEEVMEEIHALLAPQGQDTNMFLYDDFDLPSELDDDPERECKTAEREGSKKKSIELNDIQAMQVRATPHTWYHFYVGKKCREKVKEIFELQGLIPEIQDIRDPEFHQATCIYRKSTSDP
jgi:hypothetical protein